jgi:hypothetical protein
MNRLVLALLCVAAVSCCGCPAVSESYLKADKATFDAITPEYLRYVEADPALDQEKKDRRKRTVESWRLRLDKAGGD